MKMHQLRYLVAVAQSDLNITAAAHKLHTSQPGVSKQIKLLEEELGFQIFVREDRSLTRITPAGQEVIERAIRVLHETQSIRNLAKELGDDLKGNRLRFYIAGDCEPGLCGKASESPCARLWLS